MPSSAVEDRLSLGGTAFLTVIDGAVLDASPLVMLARRPKPGIPVIVGSTDQEARLYTVLLKVAAGIVFGERAIDRSARPASGSASTDT